MLTLSRLLFGIALMCGCHLASGLEDFEIRSATGGEGGAGVGGGGGTSNGGSGAGGAGSGGELSDCDIAAGNVYLDPSTSHCYFLGTNKVTWQAARDACVLIGSDLAAITSIEERDFVDDVINITDDVWIGGTDMGSEGMFRWSNGEQWVDLLWGSGQPDDLNGQHCVVMRDNDGDMNDDWDDLTCDANRDYLCERSP